MDSFIKFYFFYPFFVLFFHVISVTQKPFFFIFALLHINIYMLHILWKDEKMGIKRCK